MNKNKDMETSTLILTVVTLGLGVRGDASLLNFLI